MLKTSFLFFSFSVQLICWRIFLNINKFTVCSKLCDPLLWLEANTKTQTWPLDQSVFAGTSKQEPGCQGGSIWLHSCSAAMKSTLKCTWLLTAALTDRPKLTIKWSTFTESTKWVATPALCTSRPLSRKPVKARNSPSFPWSLGRKYPPPTSGKSPAKLEKKVLR